MIVRTLTSAALVGLASVTFWACGNGAPGATAPSNAPTANRAPTVSLATDGPASCNPVGRPWPNVFCQVTVKAVAIDPDGDPLSYSWSGATDFSSGSGFCSSDGPVAGPNAACTIYSPEQVVVAWVIVRDDHDHTATASLNVIGEGVNHAPAVHLGQPFTLPGGSVTLEMFGWIEDPDEPNICTNDHVVGGSATGDCRPNVAFWSSCLEGGPTVDIYRTATTGTCDVTLKVRDSANLVGTTVTTIRYGTERQAGQEKRNSPGPDP
jgi:hypothetical protein